MSRAMFINPFTDFGFKKIFGEEASLPLLKSFLNALLPPHHQIEELEFRSSEFLARTLVERRAVFDLYCQSTSGERFIVELQKQKQDFFKDRMVYYTTFPIQEQAEKGEWNFQLEPVYCVGILDFCFDDSENGEVVQYIKLKNQTNKVFYEKLTFATIEMPKFDKSESELVTEMDKWLYFFKNLGNLEEVPQLFMGQEEFEAAFQKASIPQLSTQEHQQYERSLKALRDNKNVVDFAYNEGKEEGREEGEVLGMNKALEKLISSGMSEEDARKVLEL